MTWQSTLPQIGKLPNYREDPTSWLPSPSDLATSLATNMLQEPSDELASLFSAMGVPSIDLTTTLLSSRVGLLAATRGQAFYHHELRGRLPMPQGLEPERTVWEDGTLPVWEEGILTEPKYFSFFLDTPFSPYNPNYRRKWRAHELLHSIVGFYWSPQMTRFSSYLGARLDELLPIIHWYGLDEMFRPRCEKHQGQQLYRELCPDCEGMAQPYDNHEVESLSSQTSQAQEWATQAWQHFDEEWQACLNELDTGQRCETPRVHLNASSDAVGYLYSHWPRLTSWSFGSWVEQFLHVGHDYFDNIPSYMQHIAQVSQNLVSGAISVQTTDVKNLRTRRVLQDIGYRCFVALEWLEDGSKAAQRAEDAMMPIMEQAGSYCQELLHKSIDAKELNTLLTRLHETFQNEVCSNSTLPKTLQQNFAMLGYRWPDENDESQLSSTAMIQHALPQLKEGLETAFPQSWSKLQQDKLDFMSFASSTIFPLAERLSARFSRWYGQQDDADVDVWEWLKFEAWMQESPRQDNDAECFAVLPESLTDLVEQTGQLRCHLTFRQASWKATLLHDVLGENIDEATAPLAAIHHNEQQRLLLLDNDMLDVLAWVKEEKPLTVGFIQHYEPVIQALLDNSFLVWCPAPL